MEDMSIEAAESLGWTGPGCSHPAIGIATRAKADCSVLQRAHAFEQATHHALRKPDIERGVGKHTISPASFVRESRRRCIDSTTPKTRAPAPVE